MNQFVITFNNSKSTYEASHVIDCVNGNGEIDIPIHSTHKTFEHAQCYCDMLNSIE